MHLLDASRPIPCYRVGRKILVRRSDFDGWISAYRATGRVDVERVVEEVVRDVVMSRPIPEPRAPLLDKATH